MEIESSLRERYPGLDVKELVLSKVEVRLSTPELVAFKRSKQEEIRMKIPSLDAVKDQRIIRAYRDFYWKVGIDPTKTRPAGEALVRRILSGRDLPTINTLVDSYNLASAETMISIAAFDNLKIHRDHLLMRTAAMGESFAGIGMASPVSLEGGEVVIEDCMQEKLIAVYPYRDADESKVAEVTKEVLFMMCGVPEVTEEDLDLAKRTTLEYASTFCGASK